MLLKQIKQGSFIEIVKLLPENLRHPISDDDQPPITKPKQQLVWTSSVFQEVRCGRWVACVGKKR